MTETLGLLRYLATTLVLAWGGLRRNALRGVLTAMGILIGVAAVTIVVALGEAASVAVSERIDALGENSYIVRPRRSVQSGVQGGEEAPPKLTEDDGEALQRELSAVVAAAPMLEGFSQVRYRDGNTSAQLIGTRREFLEVRAWKVQRGVAWTRAAENTGEKVVLIGQTAARELFGDEEDPVGHVVQVGRHPFQVVGMLAEKGQSPFGSDLDNVLVMPIKTYRSKLNPTRPGQVGSLLLMGKASTPPDEVRRQVTALLRQRHGLAEGVEDDFRLRGQDEFRKAQNQILGVLQTLLLAIAGVSLLVGGIGVMNIMLVSVAERTREIGIRMAIGAREIDILTQFLAEAIVLSIAGGAAGALVAVAASYAIGRAVGWPMAVSPTALGVALATSMGVGVLFGFLPARRAAALDPIQALRRE